MPQEEKEQSLPSISITLREFIESHLGIGNVIRADRTIAFAKTWECRPVSSSIAQKIFSITQNKHTCYIEFPDESSPHIKEPILWLYESWQAHCDSWERAKRQSEKRRELSFIFEHNIKLIARAMEQQGFDKKIAEENARKLLHKERWGAIKALDVTLITTIEEIP